MIYFIVGAMVGFVLGSYTYYVSRRKQIHKEKMEFFNNVK